MTKTARCNFCGRSFTSPQGVRAHLKSCTSYQLKKAKPHGLRREPLREPRQPKEVLPKVKYPAMVSKALSYAQVPGIDESRYSDEGLAKERRHNEEEAWIRKKEEKEKRRLHDEREVSLCQEGDARRKHKEELERAEREKREIIQDVKRFVIDWYVTSKDIPSEAKAGAKLEIEKILSGLPVLELPEHELREIAAGIRDKTYKHYLNEMEKSEQTEAEDMEKKRLFSGIFWCEDCEIEFEIDRADESELVCDDCGGDLEEVPDDEEDEEGED